MEKEKKSLNNNHESLMNDQRKLGEKITDGVINTKIIELEDKLMDLIVISGNYENIPVPVFESEMMAILKEIEYLQTLVE